MCVGGGVRGGGGRGGGGRIRFQISYLYAPVL